MSSGSRSSEVRDALVDTLLKTIKDGVPVRDDEGNVHYAPAPAAYLAVAKDYVKAFPPVDLPKTGDATGILKQFTDRAGQPTVLPFSTQKAN